MSITAVQMEASIVSEFNDRGYVAFYPTTDKTYCFVKQLKNAETKRIFITRLKNRIKLTVDLYSSKGIVDVELDPEEELLIDELAFDVWEVKDIIVEPHQTS